MSSIYYHDSPSIYPAERQNKRRSERPAKNKNEGDIARGYHRVNYGNERKTRKNRSSSRSGSRSSTRSRSRSRSRDRVNHRIQAARNHVYRKGMYKNKPPLSKYDALISLFDQRPEVFDTMQVLFSDKIVLINKLEDLCVNASENEDEIISLINSIFTFDMFNSLRDRYNELKPRKSKDVANKEIVLIYLDYVIDNYNE